MNAFKKYMARERKQLKSSIFLVAVWSFLGLLSIVFLITGLEPQDNLYVEVRNALQLGADGLVALGLLLVFSKLLKSYEQGQQVFNAISLQTNLLIARVILLYALIAKPLLSIILEMIYFDIEISMMDYFANIEIVLATAGYILHVFCANNKVAQDLQEEQALTI
ncbi:hypothetical protein [Pseudoalteromonas phenolica]|uniref:DUF2975 domain-containing protein n=1 Tax=Pseudoalteromonas phenolica TaxID=161398 RepID=A0A0S2JY09_9GAMM|nr:hypothetical protein [Pseudoalteromonas phenolica]ALO40655.1 hypothetical protein PP2015_127 [Pseudoalteromonas phenolica]MBE0354832.1 hypothetical protein [Pseudoalteromonas phenolica O-BC30]RXF01367.1 hypothetical protein D9981_08950 [Pseudoalteromonas phenolica O-BC30]TMO53577.1 hypothetical protein CWC21_18870 [Pseudoalteromonas phenolica]